MFEGLGATLAGWGQGAGNFIQKNPEQFAIIADMMGSKLAPDNAFAGVGQMMGKSSLANTAAATQKKERQDMLQLLLPLLGGGSAEAPQQAPALDPNGQSMGSPGMFDTGQGNTPVGLPNLTAPEQAGPSSVSYKAGKDGSVIQSIVSNASGKKPSSGVNLSDLLPLLLAQSGNTPVNLTGLTPEQILGISQNDLALGQLNNQTVGTLFDSLYKKAQAEAEAGKVDSYNANQYSQAEKNQMESLIKLREEIRNSELHPLVKEDKIAEIDGRIANAAQSRASAVSSYASADSSRATAAKTRQDAGIEAERQALIKGIPEGAKLEDLPTSAQISLLGPSFQDWATGKSREELDKVKGAYGALLNSTDEKKASAADVTQWNSDAPGSATFGMIWRSGENWFGMTKDPAPVQVALPEGMSMQDVRDTAKLRKMSVDEVLRMIYDADLTRR